MVALLIHKLASKSAMSDSEVKVALLHALPPMAGDEGCISLIMKLVTSLASKPSKAPLRPTLLSKLWRIESRCYPFLQKVLYEPASATDFIWFQYLFICNCLRFAKKVMENKNHMWRTDIAFLVLKSLELGRRPKIELPVGSEDSKIRKSAP